MVDGPGMMYTPEDRAPLRGSGRAGTAASSWRWRAATPLESSRIQVFVDGELDFESDMWVYQTGSVKLTQEHKRILMTGTFSGLTFNHKENAFRIRYSDDSGLKWLTRDGAACSEEDVSFSYEPQTPPPAAWSCPACHAENEGGCCTSCGMEKPADLPPMRLAAGKRKTPRLLSRMRPPPQVRRANIMKSKDNTETLKKQEET